MTTQVTFGGRTIHDTNPCTTRPGRRLGRGVGRRVADRARGAGRADPAGQADGRSWANPGVAQVPGEGFVMLRTAAWDPPVVTRRCRPAGPGGCGRQACGTRRRSPANPRKRGVWAPSIIRGTDGRWVVYYSALVRGAGSSTRCIGTGTAATHLGPFTPDPQPLACWRGFSKLKPQDSVAASAGSAADRCDARRRGRPDGPAVDAARIREGRQDDVGHVDPHAQPRPRVAQPRHRQPGERQGAQRPADPQASPVHRGEPRPGGAQRHVHAVTSWGWYGTPNYWTQYRQTTNPWGASPKKATRLTFPKGTKTLGRGNAQAIRDSRDRWWRPFWNGHRPGSSTARSQSSSTSVVSTGTPRDSRT